eukprot:CAMPEP_0119361448 /NCGR_PEP_ID=MMETSP1334-20130426/8747_1 /TAXON_ID=127549 /ORGANISM="Calcidiscus leptoporus, Strain RCC1130" /LENGTH=370 /DNA_ID=CAMNT_0007376457 /DNA_START=1 /DNA_END=1113 /DNA_ORIENTATION=+
MEKFDGVLMEVAGQCGGIQPLLDVFFSFLYRKTDFFVVMEPGTEAKMGFADGVAEQLVLKVFHTYKKHADSTRSKLKKQPQQQQPPQPQQQQPPQQLQLSPPPPAATASVGAATASGTRAETPNEAGTGEGGMASEQSGVAAAPVAAPSTEPPASQSRIKEIQDVYNGGKTSKYTWEQTLHDVTLQVPVPAGTRARDVVCVITKTKLSLKIRGHEEALIDTCYPCDARNGQEIWEKVRADECTWSLEQSSAGPQVSVYLEKEREAWWKSALHGDNEIDTTQVDSSRSMYEYDGETQGAIRKIMFDQDQKRKGLPTSDELKNEDLLRQAWDAEGSPFKGTPFDPSKVNFNAGGGSDMPLPGMMPPPDGPSQ